MRSLICILLALLALPPIAARACSCTEPLGPLQSLAGSSAVFSGRVTNVEAIGPYQYGWSYAYVTFAVSDCWKGVLGSSVVVGTGSPGDGCGIYFQVGDDWLVYAGGPPNGLGTSSCSRTEPLISAIDDLLQLGTPRCTGLTPSTWGIVKQLYQDVNATR